MTKPYILRVYPAGEGWGWEALEADQFDSVGGITLTKTVTWDGKRLCWGWKDSEDEARAAARRAVERIARTAKREEEYERYRREAMTRRDEVVRL